MIKLGQLKGNRFSLALRFIEADKDTIEKSKTFEIYPQISKILKRMVLSTILACKDLAPTM
jgi:tRNA(Glu) U13 pseudouridine synthase TruD